MTEYLAWLLRRLDIGQSAPASSARAPFHALPVALADLDLRRPRDFARIDALKCALCSAGGASGITTAATLDRVPVCAFDGDEFRIEVSGAVAVAANALFQPALLAPGAMRARLPRSGDFLSIEQSDFLTLPYLEMMAEKLRVLSKRDAASEMSRLLGTSRASKSAAVTEAATATATAATPAVGGGGAGGVAEPSRAASPNAGTDQNAAIAFGGCVVREAFATSTSDVDSMQQYDDEAAVEVAAAASSSAGDASDAADAHLRFLCGWTVDEARHPKRQRAIGPDVRPQRSGADAALGAVVAAALASLPTDEMRLRFASEIVLIGGGARMCGDLGARLAEAVRESVPARQPALRSAVEVLRPPRIYDATVVDPQHAAWKGAAVLCGSELPTARDENWVERAEYALRGAAVVREKVVWLW